MLKQPILAPFQLGDLSLPNRVVMAPMTRSRAGEGNVPSNLNATYYAQRASAGLIISEGTQVSATGVGYVRTPGIHTEAQVAGWKQVTQAVHAAGGRIFAQLWHTGRVSHSSLLPDSQPPVAPSAIRAPGLTWTAKGQEPFSEPRALAIPEISSIVDQYGHGARCARAAGFDGIELHGANGYLIDQFLRDGVNRRTDSYGGTIPRRVRFLLEVLEAVKSTWAVERVGVRFSPKGTFNGMSDSDPEALFAYVAGALDGKVGYIHLIDAIRGPMATGGKRFAPIVRAIYSGPLIVNGGYSQSEANETIAFGEVDLVSFGTPFLANPDLPRRFAENAPLQVPDQDSFYTEGPEGYTDYPTLGA